MIFRRSLLLIVASCSSTAEPNRGPDAGVVDAPPFVPAPHPPPVQFQHMGGPTLAHPSLVTVTWAGDPRTDFVRTFDAWIAGSQYLNGSLAEYGISPASYAGSFAFPAPAPATIDADDLARSLAAEALAGRLPAPTADRLYIIYTPPGTTVLRFGFKSCETFSGSHGDVVVDGVASPIVYAVIPRCQFPGSTEEDLLTGAASHEISEAITDPIVSNPAWFTLAPAISTGAEIADACISFVRVEGYRLNPIYSNAAAKAEKRPCLPAPPGPACGLWADNPTLIIPPGGSAETTMHVYFMEPTAPDLSLMIPARPALTTLVEPTEVKRVRNGDTFRVSVTMPSNAPAFVDDLVPISLYCGTEDYVTWYYVHAKLPPP